MSETTNDHRTNLYEAFKSRSDALSDADENGEIRDEQFLEVTVWTARDHEPRVEFLLSCGGPTETVTVDCGYETVTYSHSWGKNAVGEDWTELNAYGIEADLWVSVARDYAEIDQPAY